MYKIQTLNAISDIIHTQLSADKYTVSKEEPMPDAILVRSAAMHEMEFGKELLAIQGRYRRLQYSRCQRERGGRAGDRRPDDERPEDR